MTTVPDRPQRRRRTRLLAGAGLALLLLSACARDAPQDSWQPEGTYAHRIASLNWVFYVAGVVGLLVFAALIFVYVRYRERPDREATVPRQIHGNPRLEVMWTLAPAVLLAVVAVFTVSTLFDVFDDAPPDALEINVTGQQWWWEFNYPTITKADGTAVVTSGEMVIPAGPVVRLNLSSRDVIHSFWIPRLNGKRDAVPGRVHALNMQADQPGEYWGQCAEFCGLSHANMRMRVVALDADDWATWQRLQQAPAQTPTDELALAGQASFASRCAQCHEIDGLVDSDGQPVGPDNIPLVSGVAPNLTHLMSRTTFAGGSYDLKIPGCEGDLGDRPTGTPVGCLNRTDLEQWLRNPESLKPMAPDPNKFSGSLGRGMPNLNLTEAQIDELVAYLSTLT